MNGFVYRNCGILLKFVHKSTTFQVSNDQKNFQFDITLVYRLSDHHLKTLDADDARWFIR